MNKSHNYFDFLIGSLVLLCAIGFFSYSFKNSKISTNEGYNIFAKFENSVAMPESVSICSIKLLLMRCKRTSNSS